MNDNVNEDEKAPNTRVEGSPTENRKNFRVSDLLSRALKKYEERFDSDFKPTLADYLKLVQLELEIEQEAVKEIKVTWVDPITKSED